MKTTAKIAAMLVLVLVGSVSAEVITVEVTGVVDSVSTQGGIALDGSVIVGSVMTGYCTYDTDTADQNPSDNSGRYALISISMTIGNYTFTHDPTSADSAYFIVGVSDPVYRVYSPTPRFEGTIYVDGAPRAYESIDWDWTYLKTIDLYTSSDEYITTDALPDLDSWPDISVFDYSRSFRAVFSDSVPVGSGEGSFDIIGELTLLTVIPEPATTYYVDAVDGNDNNDGLSPETAFATIQKAIDSAYNGDTVLVADGTYTGPGNRNIDFLGKAITVRSESGPENCIIDCNGRQTDPHRGFYFHKGEDQNSILDGFTITNGDADWGAGISCEESSPAITNCTFSGNWAYFGGGMCNQNNSSPTVTNCTFSGNSADYGGGGMCNGGGSPTVTNCTFSGNTAVYSGGGMYNGGSSPTVTNCDFSGNSADYSGGGMYNGGSSPTVTNCDFSGNSADYSGGGMYNWWSSPLVTNCTFSGNSALNGNACACDSYELASNVEMTNCILWDGGQEIWNNDGSTITVNYTDLQGGQADCYDPYDAIEWGLGNIDEDPYFVEPGYWADANDPNIIVEPNDPNAVWIKGDYYLLPNSLCIDAGDPIYVAEPNETDIDGNPRVINGRIDMGAYETNYIQAAMKLTPQMLNCNSKGKYIKTHLTLPEGFLPEDVDVNAPAMAEPMGAESEYIKVLGTGTGPVRLEITFDREAFCARITETGEVEITVIGSLTTSQCFYATDTIKIKPRR